MDRSEPTFVPQWLKNSGSSTGGGSIPHSGKSISFIRIYEAFSFFLFSPLLSSEPKLVSNGVFLF